MWSQVGKRTWRLLSVFKVLCCNSNTFLQWFRNLVAGDILSADFVTRHSQKKSRTNDVCEHGEHGCQQLQRIHTERDPSRLQRWQLRVQGVCGLTWPKPARMSPEVIYHLSMLRGLYHSRYPLASIGEHINQPSSVNRTFFRFPAHLCFLSEYDPLLPPANAAKSTHPEVV